MYEDSPVLKLARATVRYRRADLPGSVDVRPQAPSLGQNYISIILKQIF